MDDDDDDNMLNGVLVQFGQTIIRDFLITLPDYLVVVIRMIQSHFPISFNSACCESEC